MLSLIVQIIYDNFLKNLLLTLNIVLVFSITLFSLHYVDANTRMDRLVNEHMENCLVASGKLSDDMIEIISDHPSVMKKYDKLACYEVETPFMSQDWTAMDYSSGFFSKIEPEMYAGSLPDINKSNQIAIPYSLKDVVHIGDTFPVIAYASEDGEYYGDVGTQLEVVGILAPDVILPDYSKNVVSKQFCSWDSVFSSVQELELSDIVTVSNKIVFANGQSAYPSLSYANDFFELDSGYSADQVKAELVSKYPALIEKVYTYSELQEVYDREHADQNVYNVSLLLCSILLLIIIFFSDLYLMLKKRQVEIAEYYVCGMTWRKAVLTYFISFLPSIVFGIALAVITFYWSGLVGMLTGNDYVFSFRISIEAVIAVLVSMVCCFMPFYIEVIRQSPISIIRKE